MDLTVPSGACARSRVLGDTVINNDAAGKERTPVQNCKICAAWCAWLQHHTPIELTAQPLPIRQILSHTSLETRSMTVLPQMRHFMYQYVFEELRRHETELHIQTNAASARRAGAPARGHHAQRDTRGRAADNRLPLIQQCRKLCVDIRSRLVAASPAPYVTECSRASRIRCLLRSIHERLPRTKSAMAASDARRGAETITSPFGGLMRRYMFLMGLRVTATVNPSISMCVLCRKGRSGAFRRSEGMHRWSL